MSFGFVLPALSIGLGAIRVKPTRGFFPNASAGPGGGLVADAVIEEMHRDDMEITEHPVEAGAPVADHAFMRPAEVVIRCAWSNGPQNAPGLIGAAVGAAATASSLVRTAVGALQTASAAQSLLSGNGPNQARAIYQQLRDLQAARIPFDIYTGKRVYRNMLFRSLAETTTKDSENFLSIVATCRQVIIVNTTTVTMPVNASAQALPEKTSPVLNIGPKSLKSLPSMPSGIPAPFSTSNLSGLL